MALWKAHGRLSICISWIFHYLLRFRSYVYSSAVFAGVDLFALKFYLNRVVPRQPFLALEI